MTTKPYTLHLVSGTHWDREWRLTAEQSKLRLADLVDTALDVLERRPDYRAFCLDGGMVVVEDYLTVRPQNRGRLGALARAGRLMLLGWYTLPDTFIVAPEALIRNLLLGHRLAREFGGPIASGYSSFSYGQTSQLPQIYQGFGIRTAMFYRGTNQFETPPLFLWEGRDGSRLHVVRTFDDVTRTNWFFYPHYRLLLNKNFRDARYHYDRREVPVHFCDESLYERAFLKLNDNFAFKDDHESLLGAVAALRKQAEPHAIGRRLLGLNLQDNAWCYERLPDMIAAMNAVSPDMEIVQSTFDEYFDLVLSESRDHDLFVHRGELRHTGVVPGLTGLYGASQSSRIRLKLLNDEAETWLTRIAEPLAAAAAACGGEYPATLLARAWQHLLQNHAHDSICGAAVDQAHEDMLYRFSVARTVGQEVAARAMTELFRIDSRTRFQENDSIITLFNLLPYPRREVVPLVVDLPSVNAEPSPSDPCTGLARYDKELKLFDIVDTEGRRLEYEILGRDTLWVGVESKLDSHSIELRTVRWRLLVRAEVPALGYATLALRPREPRYIEHPQPGERPLIARPDGVLENAHLRVEIQPNGSFHLLHKASGRRFENLHSFTDSGETGSAHRSNQPQRNPVVTSLGCAARVAMLESSALRGVYEIELSLRIPAAATPDTADRVRELVDLPITVRLTLEKDCPCLKIRTRLVNRARDHRLQVHFPTGLQTDRVAVESAFAVEMRDLRWRATADNSEAWFTAQPMQNFVDLADGADGLAFLSGGLREYETVGDPRRTLSVTLLRTHRAYMKASAAMIPEELDRYTGLQCFGEQEYRYALYPHRGDWLAGGVLREAYRFKLDVKALLGVPVEGDLPPCGSFVTVEPADRLMVSALKQAEDGSGIVLRLWNVSADTLDAVVTTSLPVRAAKRLRLDETPLEDLPLQAGALRLRIAPHKIETLLLAYRG
jgi:alpha-mannosidase